MDAQKIYTPKHALGSWFECADTTRKWSALS